MKKLLIMVIVLFTIPAYVFAQEKKIPESAIKELNKVLSKFQHEVATAQKVYQEQQQGVTTIETMGMPVAQFQTPKYGFKMTNPTQIHAGASLTSKVLMKADTGTMYKIVAKMPEWYALDVAEAGGDQFPTGWVHASAGVPVIVSQSTESWITSFLVEKAIAVREYFRNSEYFYIKGFTLTAGIPPSVSIQFEFK